MEMIYRAIMKFLVYMIMFLEISLRFEFNDRKSFRLDFMVSIVRNMGKIHRVTRDE